MHTSSIVVVICLFALLGLDVYFEAFWRRDLQRDKVRRLGERTCLSSEEFWGGFYGASNLPRDRAEDALHSLAKAIGVPPGKLRPADRFLVELAPLKDGWGALDDSGLDVLVERLESKYGARIDWARLQTVDDYIRTVCQCPPPDPAGPQHAQARPPCASRVYSSPDFDGERVTLWTSGSSSKS